MRDIEEEVTDLSQDALTTTLQVNEIQRDELFAEMKVEDKKTRFRFDCGANVNVFPTCLTPASQFQPTLMRLRELNYAIINS